MLTSYQDKLKRINRPRVHITYNIETEGSEKKIELPFNMGVITNLSGDTKLDETRDHSFVNIDSDNIDNYLSQQKASLSYIVPNILTKQGNIEIKLNFETRQSLEISNIVKQVKELREVYNKINVMSKIAIMSANNTQLATIMTKIIMTKQQENLAQELKAKLSNQNK